MLRSTFDALLGPRGPLEDRHRITGELVHIRMS